MDTIERTIPVLYDLLVAGLNKLRRREYHRPPLCRVARWRVVCQLHVGRKDIARAAWFFQAGQRIVVVRCFVKKSPKTPPGELELARQRMAEYLGR